MGKKTSGDQLYLLAESLAQDFSLFPKRPSAAYVKGLISDRDIEIQLERLRNMDVDSYIEATVQPVEEPSRPGAREIIKSFDLPIIHEIESGPFYAAELEMDFEGMSRRVGFITQNRAVNSGIWMPEHHELAAQTASDFAIRSLPIVNFMDTPGADAGEEANNRNQAHSISRLIAELCNVDVPTLGIIIGQGYSGGAIPLAASNLLLSTRTSVFNTIHPKGLANLVRRNNLSWQECAKFVGVSPYELYKQGNIDGIVDYDPGEIHNLDNLKNVIVSSLLSIEQSVRDFVSEHPEILHHYQRNIIRYLNQSESMAAVHASSTLKLRTSPTQYPNVFGVAFRYLRYLSLRKRIRTSTTTQYGRLSVSELPKGELAQRVNRERRTVFLGWLQDPDMVLYEDALNKSWKNFVEKRDVVDQERSRIAQLIFGERRKNYEVAKGELCLSCGLHLYNRWKAGARDNLTALIEYLKNHESNVYLLDPGDIKDAKGLLHTMEAADSPFVTRLKDLFSYEGKKLFDVEYVGQKSEFFIYNCLISELNLILEGPSLYDPDILGDQSLTAGTMALIADSPEDVSNVQLNRRLLEDTLWSFVDRKTGTDQHKDEQDLTILDVLMDKDIRDDFIIECQNLIVFGIVYDELINDLLAVARQAHESKSLSQDFVRELLERAINMAIAEPVFDNATHDQLSEQFSEWMENFADSSVCPAFLKSVEEWIRIVHPDKSDTLFVIVSFFFEKVLPEYYEAYKTGKRFEGRVNPLRIGRRKDFWNRLTIAYCDLLFHEILTREKRRKNSTVEAFKERFFDDFTELNETLMTADPVSFPTLRPSIEDALKKGVTPCGLVTGIATFKSGQRGYRVGTVISNVDFQAGCIDSASCEKFCKLLVECSIQGLPVICFISSGGMQTKEGASVLFAMPVVNDRITRFVRDNDLPVIMFGFGDCTGGSQASFVTHPLVQTYYFSGTSMPFAGQPVVESNLPFTCLLSNYLSVKPGAMRGLVEHPFAEDLDTELRSVDPEIPLPTETVTQVVDRIMRGTLTAARPQTQQHLAVEADLIKPIKRTLIHARGCTAVKLIRKAQEFGVEVVLVQSDPDMDSVPADMVNASERDRVVCIGGNTSDESYLNALSVLRIAEDEKVDSLHPGIGFLSEDPNFARLCRDHRINFVGPSVASMEAMGNKSNAISTTMAIQVPVVPGSHGIVSASERAAEVSDEIGYPVLIKAVHGGGGKGIQVVERAGQIHSLFHQVTTEARNAFGNGDIYIEKYVVSLRHIEAQILRDTHGNTKVLGIRDCSIQRDNQKLMEESGSTMLSKKLKKDVIGYAKKIAEAVDYTGAGTVEFIYDIPSEAVYFMEMNTRLQIEHAVTEVVTGIDIVKAQFDIASGKSIANLKTTEKGYGLEVRVNAERVVIDGDGNVSFVPSPGEITECILPDQPHVQLISMAAKGKRISPFYDSLIVQIICWGTDRLDAINNMSAYLSEVTINGICTNISLIRRILRDEEFISGVYDTEFLPEFLTRIDANALVQEIEAASGITERRLDIEELRIEGSDEIKVISPSTGVFYLTPSPSEPEYVNVGDEIDTGQILCQLEAMKMFTSLRLSSFSNDKVEVYPSSTKYVIVRINQAGGQQVNEGDLLFVIKPADPANDS